MVTDSSRCLAETHSLHSTEHHWKDHSTGDWGTQDGTMEVEAGREILLQATVQIQREDE